MGRRPDFATWAVTYQIHLAWASISFVGVEKTEERILGGLRNGLGREVGDGSHGGRDVTGNIVEAGERGRGLGI